MSQEPLTKIQGDKNHERRVRNLVYGRLVLNLILFVGGIIWIYSFTSFTLSSIPNGIALLFMLSVALAAVYLVMLKTWKSLEWQVRIQFVIDIALVTWLVWGTGDLISPYVTLYVILVGVAGFYLRKIEVNLIAAICALCFTILALLSTQDLIYSISGEVAPSRAVQIILFNIAAILLVGLLAGRMADRRNLGEQLQKAEEEFADLNILHERILSSIKSGLVTTDLQGTIRAFNRSAEQLAGVTSAEAVGRSVFTVFGDELRTPIEVSLRGVHDPGFVPPSFEAHIKADPSQNGSGVVRTAACTVTPLIGRSGGVTGLIIVLLDTTELHEMAENLRRADRLSAVGRMAAGLAHEIRNPLGSISSAVQFLSEKGTHAKEGNALMNVVVRESDRLNRIISDFLTYARPNSDFASKNIKQVDAGEAVDDCLALLRHDPAVREKHIFEFAKPPKPLFIETDESKIKQVIWNLLQNSIQAMPDGGTLKVALEEPNQNFARLVFSDNGCGIDSDNLENIYEPFQSGARGTGLGLSIVHRLVTEGGGRIDVESEKGIGTKITIELPKSYVETPDRR